MNRINPLGIKLVEYKKELGKEYPLLIKDALLATLEQMVTNRVFDLDTFNLIKDEDVSLDALQEYILSKPEFQKSHDEILKDFEVLRIGLIKHFEEADGIILLESESLIPKEAIKITREFKITKSFALNYFQIPEDDVEKLMKRKGFIEKFAVLRLNSIFHTFLAEHSQEDKAMEWGITQVYYDKDEDNYNLDLYFEIPIEVVEKETGLDETCTNIKTLVNQAETYYEARMMI